jgi:hypothetical protein
MSADTHLGQSVSLTHKQQTAFDCLVRNDGEGSEGLISDECYPVVIRVRPVVNALQKKGLLRFSEWIDDERGHELALTIYGRNVGGLNA